MTRKTERAINTSAKNVFDVLRLLLKTDHPIGVLEISRITSLPPSSVHRALVSLEESRFASRGLDISKYIPGPMIHHLLRAMLNRYVVRHEAYESLSAIAELSGQTTSLFVRLGWYTLLVATVEGSDEVCHARSSGEVMLLSETPAGISLLSRMDDRDITAFRLFVAKNMAEHSNLALSPKIDKLIEQSKNTSYLSMDIDEPEKRRATAFPILGDNKNTLMCVGISGPVPHKDTPARAMPDKSIVRTIKQLEKRLSQLLEEHSLPFANIEADNIILETHLSRI